MHGMQFIPWHVCYTKDKEGIMNCTLPYHQVILSFSIDSLVCFSESLISHVRLGNFDVFLFCHVIFFFCPFLSCDLFFFLAYSSDFLISWLIMFVIMSCDWEIRWFVRIQPDSSCFVIDLSCFVRLATVFIIFLVTRMTQLTKRLGL